MENVFVPFLGDFFSMRACEAPARLLSQAHSRRGWGGSLHQALSFGDEMPIFPGRAGIGGDLQ